MNPALPALCQADAEPLVLAVQRLDLDTLLQNRNSGRLHGGVGADIDLRAIDFQHRPRRERGRH